MPTVLIVTTDAAMRQRLSEVMGAASCQVAVAGDLTRVQKLARILAFDVALVDRASFRGEPSALVEELRRRARPRPLLAVAIGAGDLTGGFDACFAHDASDHELLATVLGGGAQATVAT